MREFLYFIMEIIAECHTKLLNVNNAYEYNFTDKELHFIIIGIIGMVMIFVIYPIFKWLAENDHVMTITWIYVFTLIIVLTFAIEIGQKISNTGAMEFADIMFGVVGFLIMYIIFVIIRGIFHWIVSLFRK